MAIPDNCEFCNFNLSGLRSIGNNQLVEFHISGRCKNDKKLCQNCGVTFYSYVSDFINFCSGKCNTEYNKQFLEKSKNENPKLNLNIIESGLCYNEGKTNWHLVPFESLEEFVKVLEFGATKYAPFNWQKGLSFSETFNSLMRHAISWINGEDLDKETNLNHMAHIICNAVFLIHFQRNIDCYQKFDDRWEGISTPKAEKKINNGKINIKSISNQK